MQSQSSDCYACVHVCALTGNGSSCLLELHTVLEVQPMTMLTSVSCTTSSVLCTTLSHLHKAMESHHIYMHTHNLPVTAHLHCITFREIVTIECLAEYECE